MSECLPSSEYARLLLANVPLIDLRAPAEFTRGAFPAAINLPLMSDDERAAVGTCYKEQGQRAAIELGHKLVSGEIKQARIDAWLSQVNAEPDSLLYCFRGGMRSQISQRWLTEAGLHRPYIEGGYKGMRQFLIQKTEQISEQADILVVAGMTGSGKTDFLNRRNDSIDLEALANHRGSSFGRRVGGQPTQINFENSVALALMRHKPHQLILEDESKLIGREQIPLPLFDAMSRAPRVMLEVTQEARIEQIRTDYVVGMLAEHQAHYGEESGFNSYAESLLSGLHRIRRRLGGLLYQQLRQQLLDALERQRNVGDTESHRGWIHALLEHYYDPMYRYMQEQSVVPIAFAGPPNEVDDYLNQRCVAK